MKNILLATTALVMTAGFASAEVTFSGTAEGGVTRTAKTDAVTAVLGVQSTYVFTSGAIVETASTTAATATTIAAKAAILTVESNEYAAAVVAAAAAKVVIEAALNTAGGVVTDSTYLSALGTYNAAVDLVATTRRDVALATAVLAAHTGTAAVTAVAAGDIVAYSGYDFNIGLSGASDNGITFAAGFDMGAGSLSDIANNELDAQTTTIGAPTVSATMNGYTVAFSADGIDDLYDDSQNGDASVAGTIGGVTFKVVHDLEADTAASAATFKAASGNAGDANYKAATFTDAVKAVYNTTSYTLGTTVGGVGLALTGTDANDEGLAGMKAKATYVMDALTFGIESNNRGDSTKKLNANKVSVAYAGEGVSASVSSNDDKDWDLSATLSAGANSATFSTDEESAWDATVTSDLGGGASVFGYVDHTELFMAGVRFKF